MENQKVLGLDGKMYTQPKEVDNFLQNPIKENIGTIMDINNDDHIEMNKKLDEAMPSLDEKTMQRLIQYQNRKPSIREYNKIGRNDPCPCGAVDENGKPKKYKNCCLSSGKYEKLIKK